MLNDSEDIKFQPEEQPLKFEQPFTLKHVLLGFLVGMIIGFVIGFFLAVAYEAKTLDESWFRDGIKVPVSLPTRRQEQQFDCVEAFDQKVRAQAYNSLLLCFKKQAVLDPLTKALDYDCVSEVFTESAFKLEKIKQARCL